MGPEVLLIALGFSESLLSNIVYEKIQKFSRKIKKISLNNLFVDAFFESLDRHGKGCGETVKKLKASIKKEKEDFINLFITNELDYIGFTSALQNKTFHKIAAEKIVRQFQVEENFKEVMVLIISDCLAHYRENFIEAMNKRMPEQLGILLHDVNFKILHQELKVQGDKIISEIKKIAEMKGEREIEKKAKKEEKKKGKQIKILSITASPDDAADIFYEQEQDTMLNSFQDFDRDDVYLDMPDPVKSTMDEIKERLEDGKHDILHITAHGGINDKGEGVLCFEDHRGKLETVTGSQLAEVLKGLTPAPVIVILSPVIRRARNPI